MPLNKSAGLGTAVPDNIDYPALILRVRTLRKDDWRITLFADKSFGKLFNLKGDPGQFINRSNDQAHESQKYRLMAEMLEIIIQTDPPVPPLEAFF